MKLDKAYVGTLTLTVGDINILRRNAYRYLECELPLARPDLGRTPLGFPGWSLNLGRFRPGTPSQSPGLNYIFKHEKLIPFQQLTLVFGAILGPSLKKATWTVKVHRYSRPRLVLRQRRVRSFTSKGVLMRPINGFRPEDLIQLLNAGLSPFTFKPFRPGLQLIMGLTPMRKPKELDRPPRVRRGLISQFLRLDVISLEESQKPILQTQVARWLKGNWPKSNAPDPHTMGP